MKQLLAPAGTSRPHFYRLCTHMHTHTHTAQRRAAWQGSTHAHTHSATLCRMARQHTHTHLKCTRSCAQPHKALSSTSKCACTHHVRTHTPAHLCSSTCCAARQPLALAGTPTPSAPVLCCANATTVCASTSRYTASTASEARLRRSPFLSVSKLVARDSHCLRGTSRRARGRLRVVVQSRSARHQPQRPPQADAATQQAFVCLPAPFLGACTCRRT